MSKIELRLSKIELRYLKEIEELKIKLIILNTKYDNMSLKVDALYDNILKNNAKRRKKKAKK